jgi:hypothetical protein
MVNITFREFVKDYYDENDKFFVMVLNRDNKVMKSYLNTISTLDYKRIYALKGNNRKNMDVYLSLNTFTSNREESSLKHVLSLFFDIDTNGPAIKKQIIAELGAPTYLIQTSHVICQRRI